MKAARHRRRRRQQPNAQAKGLATARSDAGVTQKYLEMHLQIGIDSLKQLINKGETVKHLRF